MPIFIFFFFLSVPIPSYSATLNWTVGKVGENYITVRDVQISQTLEKILYSKVKRPPPVPQPTQRRFSKYVRASLIEWVVSEEATHFSVGKVNNTELAQAIRLIDHQVTQVRGWKKLEVSKLELRSFVQRKMKAKKFIRFKTESTIVPITDTEAKDYYEKNREKFGHLPFKSFKNKIKSFLSRRYRDQRLSDWFEVLNRKYDVRNIHLEQKNKHLEEKS